MGLWLLGLLSFSNSLYWLLDFLALGAGMRRMLVPTLLRLLSLPDFLCTLLGLLCRRTWWQSLNWKLFLDLLGYTVGLLY